VPPQPQTNNNDQQPTDQPTNRTTIPTPTMSNDLPVSKQQQPVSPATSTNWWGKLILLDTFDFELKTSL
jgi:hypothetical protein